MEPHSPKESQELDDADEASPDTATEVPINGTALEKVSAYFRIAFADADARGEAIGLEDAQAIATVLAELLPPDSEMHRFAEVEQYDPAALRDECAALKSHNWRTPDIKTWLVRLEQHLAAHTDSH